MQGGYPPVGQVRAANNQRPRHPSAMQRRDNPYNSNVQGARNMSNQQVMRPAGPGAPQRATYKLNTNTRNQYPAQSVIPPPPPPEQGQMLMGGQEPLTASILATASQSEQKQMIGERLFPLVQDHQPTLAGKITGMLLEIDNSELLHMLEQRELLSDKVKEAVQVLQAHQAKEAQAQAASTGEKA